MLCGLHKFSFLDNEKPKNIRQIENGKENNFYKTVEEKQIVFFYHFCYVCLNENKKILNSRGLKCIKECAVDNLAV